MNNPRVRKPRFRPGTPVLVHGPGLASKPWAKDRVLITLDWAQPNAERSGWIIRTWNNVERVAADFPEEYLIHVPLTVESRAAQSEAPFLAPTLSYPDWADELVMFASADLPHERLARLHLTIWTHQLAEASSDPGADGVIHPEPDGGFEVELSAHPRRDLDLVADEVRDYFAPDWELEEDEGWRSVWVTQGWFQSKKYVLRMILLRWSSPDRLPFRL